MAEKFHYVGKKVIWKGPLDIPGMPWPAPSVCVSAWLLRQSTRHAVTSSRAGHLRYFWRVFL